MAALTIHDTGMEGEKDAQTIFRESEEVVVCHFPRKVCNIDQLLEPHSGYSPLRFNERNTVMG